MTQGRAEPEPLISRDNIFEVEERVDRSGEVVTPLDTGAVARIIAEIKRKGLESVGVCFLFSFRNPDHEREVKALLARDAPDIYISTSCDVCPEIRDYERACTTHINAYVQPATDKYLRAVDRELKKSGMTATLEVMESNGGVSDPATASQRAVNMLLSGPVGGVMGGAYLGDRTGYRNLISFDMGGTSCDISLIQEGQATLSTPITSTATHCKFEGWDVLIPFIDIHTIGSGGGSVAWLDDVGALHVGPESMGAGARTRLLRQGRRECNRYRRRCGPGLHRPRLLPRRANRARRRQSPARGRKNRHGLRHLDHGRRPTVYSRSSTPT